MNDPILCLIISLATAVGIAIGFVMAACKYSSDCGYCEKNSYADKVAITMGSRFKTAKCIDCKSVAEGIYPYPVCYKTPENEGKAVRIDWRRSAENCREFKRND